MIMILATKNNYNGGNSVWLRFGSDGTKQPREREMANGEELRQRIYIAIHLLKHQQRSARSQLGTVFQ